MTPRPGALRYLIAPGFFTLRWWEWGPADGPVVICVHGLTRAGLDFEVLGDALARQGRRVLAPDLPGRGGSDWLPDPGLYAPPTYMVALSHLMARLDGPVDWVGTSLGGICGMAMAAAPRSPIRRLVLNDVGFQVPQDAVARIRDYMEDVPLFPDIAALEAYLRRVHAPFGPLTDAQWRRMAEISARPDPEGHGLRLHYDPAIAVPILTTEPAALDLSQWWQGVEVPTLVLHGADSDLLLPETAAAMARRPHVTLREFPGIGHAPALMDPAQTALLGDFLGR